MNLKFKVTSNTKEWDKVKKRLLAANTASKIGVGWFNTGSHPNNRSSVPIAQIASWLETGTERGSFIPPRPFIRSGFMYVIANTPWFQTKLKKHMPMIADGKMTWTAFYKSIGPELEKLLQLIMREWDVPGNAEATIALKGFDDPLFESGHLISQVEWKILPKGA